MVTSKKVVILVGTIQFLILLSVSLHIQKKSSSHLFEHNYYNLESSQRISKSASVEYLDKCKERCLTMSDIFPFQFKYHRLIYRQPQGNLKYVTGQCLYTFKLSNQEKKKNQDDNRTWYEYKKLKEFLEMNLIENQQYKKQQEQWTNFSEECENESMKLSEDSIKDFQFTLIHSDFQYYQNQGFKNLQPFDDLDYLIQGLSRNHA